MSKLYNIITGVKALSKIGAKPVEKWKLQAAKAKKDAASFNLKQTFKKTDESLEKLKKTVQTTKHYYKD